MSSSSAVPSLVSPAWLKEHINSVKILDATWYVMRDHGDPLLQFCTIDRIPGAQFYDLDAISDRSTNLPHMLPNEHQFAVAADALNITNDDTVVIYDRLGIFSAPRAWWTWHVFGHEHVAVLDGGLPGWRQEGGDVDITPMAEAAVRAPAGAVEAAPGSSDTKYKAILRVGEVRNWQEVLDNITTHKETLVDARPAARWRGEAPEPRPGLKKGAIPGSTNIPWDTVLRDGRMKSPEELVGVFTNAGIDINNEALVASCGSGTTACILALAVRQAAPERAQPVAIYDGSWSEWGQLEGGLGLPVSPGNVQ